jgi:CheY-like chemotaxis protein
VGKGTGLGLSMVFGFVKQSGGSIEIDGEEGRGAIFRIYLPKADASALPVTEGDERPVIGGHEAILCVEDDLEVRQFVTLQLESLGYKTIVAASAAEALAIADRGTKFDLLFTDIVMPDMNGRRLADKARETWPDLRVLYTTGYTRNAIVHNGMLDANVAFLPKPFTMEQLAVKVRQVIDGLGANRPV